MLKKLLTALIFCLFAYFNSQAQISIVLDSAKLVSDSVSAGDSLAIHCYYHNKSAVDFNNPLYLAFTLNSDTSNVLLADSNKQAINILAGSPFERIEGLYLGRHPADLKQGDNIIVVWPTGQNINPPGPHDKVAVHAKSKNGNTGLEPVRGNSSHMRLYPNPATNAVFISSDGDAEKISSMIVYDLAGQRMEVQRHTGFSGNETLDISRLPNGIYLLKIGYASGQTETFRLIRNE
jgi:hypothetical protein